MFDWSNKNVVYVGGFSGIGYQVCQMIMKKSIKYLIVCGRMENVEMLKKLQAINSSVKVMFVQMNIVEYSSIVKAVKQVVEYCGHVDVLINGAGVLADKDIETTVAVNLTGLINTTLMLMPYMDKTQSGHGGMVVNISSVYGLEPGPAFSVYSAAKHGVVGFTRSMARGVIQSSMIALNYMDKSKGGRGGTIVNISSIAGIETTGMFAIYSAAKHGVTAFSRSMANPLYFHHTQVNFITICPGLTETALLDNVQDKTTLREYSGPMVQRFGNIKRQTAEACAQNLVKVVEINKLGSVWLLDLGEMSEVEMPIMWKPTTNSN